MENKIINTEEVASIRKTYLLSNNYKLKKSLLNWMRELTGEYDLVGQDEMYSVLFRNKIYEIDLHSIKLIREDIKTIPDNSELDIKHSKGYITLKAYEGQEVVNSKTRKLVFSKKYRID